MKFNSKKDWWLTLIIWGGALFAIGSGMYGLMEKPADLFIIFIVIFGAIIVPLFMLWMWFTTYYILNEENLIIKYGPFKSTIPLQSINRVKKTNNPLSSPALSLKRVEILYDKYNSVFISPVDRDEFIALLCKRCPQIEYSKSKTPKS
ncbi:PH domain-containing protein [Niallia taxi]|uniref:PH domain-containing protein n=1 Tax=Niallia taxi TaxID=2499688 RepID=UPI0015F6303A|nr:PH domain-containing protein [Niallia taxi]MCM3213941.1 PH domain-containing protein [Niallia taxi]MDK8642061.1 PH domain-containing protein [Niallia taxi]MED4039651.1 PH domain-containing protein [Niallia taxi]